MMLIMLKVFIISQHLPLEKCSRSGQEDTQSSVRDPAQCHYLGSAKHQKSQAEEDTMRF